MTPDAIALAKAALADAAEYQTPHGQPYSTQELRNRRCRREPILAAALLEAHRELEEMRAASKAALSALHEFGETHALFLQVGDVADEDDVRNEATRTETAFRARDALRAIGVRHD